jgi:hypothetical protein
MKTIDHHKFFKTIKQVARQPTSKPAQKQDEQQVQPMGNELVNAPNTYAT